MQPIASTRLSSTCLRCNLYHGTTCTTRRRASASLQAKLGNPNQACNTRNRGANENNNCGANKNNNHNNANPPPPPTLEQVLTLQASMLQTMQQTMANMQQAQGHQPTPQAQPCDKLGEF
jgi:hypothetical protein